MTINPSAPYPTGTKDKAARSTDIRLTCRRLLPILFLLTSLALAADASGKWIGSLEFKGEDGQAQTASAHADLKQKGNTVTGRVWKEEGQQFEIEEGQITGKEISFKFRAPEGEEEQMLVHSVKLVLVSATRLEGTLEFEVGGQKVTGKLAFSREK